VGSVRQLSSRRARDPRVALEAVRAAIDGDDTRRTFTRARIRNAVAARHASYAKKLRARLARDTALSDEAAHDACMAADLVEIGRICVPVRAKP